MVEQKMFNRHTNCSTELIIMRCDELRFRLVEQKCLFNQPKKCSSDLILIGGDKFYIHGV